MSMFRKAQVIAGVMILALVSVSVSAQSMGPKKRFRGNEETNYVTQAMQLLLSQKSGEGLGAVTRGELQKALDVVSIARQQQAYVGRSEMASFMVPGAGQFINKDPVSGSLFLGGDIAVVAGTLVGAYFLLPSGVNFSSINYYTASFNSIKTAWMNYGIKDYLPSAAVMFGGMIVDHLIRHFAAENAADLARTRIKDKKVTFHPEPFLMVPGPRGPRMGFGFGMSF